MAGGNDKPRPPAHGRRVAPRRHRDRDGSVPVSVRYFLVTAPDGPRMRMWMVTAAYANWLEGRTNRHGTQTWGVTVFGEHADHFLEVARAVPVTLEEIVGAGDAEQYQLLVGEPGTGWSE